MDMRLPSGQPVSVIFIDTEGMSNSGKDSVFHRLEKKLIISMSNVITSICVLFDCLSVCRFLMIKCEVRNVHVHVF